MVSPNRERGCVPKKKWRMDSAGQWDVSTKGLLSALNWITHESLNESLMFTTSILLYNALLTLTFTPRNTDLFEVFLLHTARYPFHAFFPNCSLYPNPLSLFPSLNLQYNPGQLFQLVGASSHWGFNFWSGNIPGLQVQSPVSTQCVCGGGQPIMKDIAIICLENPIHPQVGYQINANEYLLSEW